MDGAEEECDRSILRRIAVPDLTEDLPFRIYTLKHRLIPGSACICSIAQPTRFATGLLKGMQRKAGSAAVADFRALFSSAL